MALGNGTNIKLATLFYELEARTGGLSKDLDESKSKLGELSEFIKANPMIALAALGVAIVGIGAKSVQAAAEFELNMAKVNTVAKLSQDQLAGVSDQVQQMFRKYPVTDAKILTDGLYQIVSSGFGASEAMKILDVSTQTAIGGFTTTETVVDALTSILNAYKDKNLDAGQTADVLARAVADGKIEMGELSQSIGGVVGIAATFGTSIEDVTAVLVRLSLGGIKTAEGVTALRSAIVNIIRPSNDFIKQFPELAKQFDETRLKADGFVKFLTDFQKESGGSSEALKALFRDTQGYNGVVSLLKDNGVGLLEQQAKMRESAGFVASAFAEVNRTADAQYQIIKNNLSSAFTELGEKILPAVNAVLGVVLDFLQRINGEAARLEVDKALDKVINKAKEVENATESSSSSVKKNFQDLAQEALKLYNDFELGRKSLKDLNATQLNDLAASMTSLAKSPLATGFMAERFNEIARAAKAASLEVTDFVPTALNAGTAVGTVAPPVKLTKEQLEAAAKAAEKARKELVKLQKDVEKAAESALDAYNKRLKSKTDKLADAIAQSTETLVDDMQLALQRAIKEFEELGATEAEIGQFKEIREGSIRAQESIEKIGKVVKELGDTQGDVRTLGLLIGRVNELIGEQQAIRNRPGVSDAERVAAESNIEKLTQTRTTLEGRIADVKSESQKATAAATGQELDASNRLLSNVQAKANALTVAATGALKLASAFGVMSKSSADTLTNLITIGTQAVSLAKSIGEFFQATGKGASEGGTAGAIAAAATSLAGSIAGLIDADAKARAERTRVTNANTDALKQLTRATGDLLKVQLSGKNIQGTQDALQTFLNRFSNLGDFREFGKKFLEGIDPKKELEKLGIDFSNITDLAKAFGITLDGQIGSYRKLLAAIQGADLQGFVNDFSGALDALDTEIKVNAEKFKTDSDKFAALVGLLNDPEKGAPALFDALKGIDTSTAEGQQKALEEIKKLFQKLKDGNLTKEDLGNLNLSDFKDIINRLNDEIRGIIEAAANAATTGDTTPAPTPTTGDTTPNGSSDTPPTPTPDPNPAPDTTPTVDSVDKLKELTIALGEFVVPISDLVELFTPEAVSNVAAYVEEMTKLQEALTAPLNAAAALQSSASQRQIEAPILDQKAQQTSNTFNFSLEVSGTIIGMNEEELGRYLADIVFSRLNTAFGRELTRESLVTGNRSVVIS